MRILGAAIYLVFAAPLLAGDFVPEHYGLTDGAQTVTGSPAIECRDVRIAEDGRNKSWECSDGNKYFGPTDIWSRPSTLAAPNAPSAFDPVIRLPDGKSMLTIRHWVDDRYCSGTKTRSCSGREVVSVSHMIVDRDQCETLGEQLAYDDYVNSGRPGERIKISWQCR